MSSQVQICNLALSKYGDITIASINDDTPQARNCKALWDTVRDLLLYAHPWNFAMERAELTRLAAAPAFGPSYQYALPINCLRAWELYNSDSEWEIESGKLLVNDEEVYLRYISKITDVSKFNPAFCACLSLALAIELAPKMAISRSDRTNLVSEFNLKIDDAYKLNFLEGKRPEAKEQQPLDKGNFSWQKEGR